MVAACLEYYKNALTQVGSDCKLAFVIAVTDVLNTDPLGSMNLGINKYKPIKAYQMNIELSGHHVDITDAMKSIANKKFNKLGSRFADLGTVSIIVKVERNIQTVEVNAHFLGDSISVSSKDMDFYKAIDQAATKFSRSLESRKGHIETKGREKPVIAELDDDVD